MDNFSIQCFLAVTNLKSFTKAAQRLGRTQSAITQQIAGIEKMLNCKLFDRSKQLGLTKEGQVLWTYALKLDSIHKELLDRFHHPELEGQIRFGVPEDFATVLLSDVLGDFSRDHPRVYLNVHCDLSVNLFKKFKDGLLDLVLLKMISSEEFPQGLSVWKEPLVWVGSHQSVSDFKGKCSLPLVLAPDPCVYKKAAIDSLSHDMRHFNVVYTSPSYAGIIAAVKAGIGLTVLPITMIPQDLQRILDPSLPALSEVHVCLLHGEKPSKSVESMKMYLIEQMSKQYKTLGHSSCE